MSIELAVKDAINGFEARIASTFQEYSASNSSYQDVLAQCALVEHALLSALHRFRAHMNYYAPINRLPVEVLLLIFRHYHSTNCGDAPTWSSSVQPVVTITHVCRHWRAAALDDANLWTTVSAQDYNELQALPVILSRSKMRPVDIAIEWRLHILARTRASVLQALNEHLSHTRALRLHVRDEHSSDWVAALTSPAPLLETFELVRGSRLPEPLGAGIISSAERRLFGAHAPRLRDVTLENAALDTLDAPDVFRGVAELSVSQHNITPQDVRAVLASCPNVQDLNLTGSASPSALARIPQPRRGGTWPCPALTRLSFTDVNPRAVDLILPHLPLDQLALLDIVHTDAELFAVFELAPTSVAALLPAEGEEEVRSVALRGSVHPYPPRVHWDVIVINARNASRAFPLSRPQRHPALMRAIAHTPVLSVSVEMWPALVDLLSDSASFAAHRLALTVEEPNALSDLCAAALRPLHFPALRRVVISAKTRKMVPSADLLKLLEKMVAVGDLRGGKLKKLTLKGIRHKGRLDDLYSLAQQVQVGE
ncbi:hypothetical protein EXIGLDRAFT_756895 [Exidia glandulosa HHB12029]|uniref:F-box domain-containing protein n=1 Tax=Exidia glandulosa HHB12029 TaxID=1314781 RepID=A0A165AYJ5_EXIGL|nr:hypothetical protein EXIGLDRAFT_756895 [Exidia glandulosa HHB12029]